ncbi:MAG: E2/UBC family protein [Hyphomicrobiaceae bacterium]|nr:E2/UBC family protein [Hyphomicrobiaceae bacterium]
MLPAHDMDYLKELSPDASVTSEAGMVCVLIPSFPLPAGFDRPSADLLVRLATGYPDVAPDMWWFDPPVKRTDGATIPATESRERHLNREWQRWSRHLQPGQWKSGIDSLESYIALVRKELEAARPAAMAA